MARQKTPDYLKLDHQITFTVQRDMGVRFAALCKEVNQQSVQTVLRDMIASFVEAAREVKPEVIAETNKAVINYPPPSTPPPKQLKPGDIGYDARRLLDALNERERNKTV